jgi:hypothetical protein
MQKIIIEWRMRINILAFECDRKQIAVRGKNAKPFIAPHSQICNVPDTERERENQDREKNNRVQGSRGAGEQGRFLPYPSAPLLLCEHFLDRHFSFAGFSQINKMCG